MVVGHRFAPVTHHEVGIGFGRFLKGFERFFVPERVQCCEAAQEMGLGCGRTGGWEVDSTELRLLGTDG